MPDRIQLRRTKGWRMPPDTVKVDRSTKWGNPFIVGEFGTRDECGAAFRQMLTGHIIVSRGAELADAQRAYLDMAVRDIHELRGKQLACWCSLHVKCHADILIEAANSDPSGLWSARATA